jgi:acyl-CoA reductase-like NAD-dependent aldehyde dehydrogenase
VVAIFSSEVTVPTYDAQLFLAGQFVDGATDKAIAVHSPVTGEHLADLPVPSAGQVDDAVAAAREAFDQYRHWS